MFAIFKREIRSYFQTVVGWLLLQQYSLYMDCIFMLIT